MVDLICENRLALLFTVQVADLICEKDPPYCSGGWLHEALHVPRDLHHHQAARQAEAGGIHLHESTQES